MSISVNLVSQRLLTLYNAAKDSGINMVEKKALTACYDESIRILKNGGGLARSEHECTSAAVSHMLGACNFIAVMRGKGIDHIVRRASGT